LNKYQTFSFRDGESLMPRRVESKDGGKVAAFPPLNDPPSKTART